MSRVHQRLFFQYLKRLFWFFCVCLVLSFVFVSQASQSVGLPAAPLVDSVSPYSDEDAFWDSLTEPDQSFSSRYQVVNGCPHCFLVANGERYEISVEVPCGSATLFSQS